MPCPNFLFTKTFRLRGLTFTASLYEGGGIELKRLPEFKLDPGTEGAENDMPQTCTVAFKDAVDPKEAFGWDTSVAEMVDLCESNCGCYDPMILFEYVGRESSSENNDPDRAMDGFLDWEMGVAIETLGKDAEFRKRAVESHAANVLLGK